MSLILDPATEQRVQREAGLRNIEDPLQLINRALDYYIESESWPEEEKVWLNQRLDESMAGIERGEGIPEEKVRDVLAADRAARRR